MKEIILAVAVTVCVSAFPLLLSATERTGGSHSEEMQQKEQYEKSMEERLRKLGKELDELKAKAATMTRHASGELDRYIADAEKKRKAVARKLNEMKREGKKKWGRFSGEVNAAMEEFEKAYERARTHFKE